MNVCTPYISGRSLDDNKCLVKLIFSFLLSYPLAALLKRVPDEKPALKNLFIITQVLSNLTWMILSPNDIQGLYILSRRSLQSLGGL